MFKSQKSHSLVAKFAVAAVALPAFGLAYVSANAAFAADATPAVSPTPAASSASDAPRCDTYKAPDGSTYFALSLPAVSVEPTNGCDMLVFFDTSAGQAGVARDKAFEALDMLLHAAGQNDHVNLFAVDDEPIEMTKGFVAPRSAEMEAAVAQLHARVPLGATDMGLALRKAADVFHGKSSAQRAIVYLGDGSSAGDRTVGGYNDTVCRLAAEHVPVISYAVGRQLDASLLAALANQTGGNLVVDGENLSGKEVGQTLTAWAEAPVLWPTSTTLPKAIAEAYPSRTPPLRTDRDTVILGKLSSADPGELKISGEVASGKTYDLSWTVAPKASNIDNAFVAPLVDAAKADGGMRLPTLGTAGLLEARRLIHLGAQQLAQVGSQIAATGNKEPARQVVAEALRRDPENARALALESQLDGHVKQVAAQGPESVGAPPPAEPPASPGDLRLVGPSAQPGPAPGSDQANLLQQFTDINKLQVQQLVADVNHDLDTSRAQLATNPAGVIQQLRMTLDRVQTTPGLPADVRAQLVDSIQAGLLQAANRQQINDEQQSAALRRAAEAKENLNLQEALSMKQEKVKQLTERMNALLAEGRYAEAHDDAAGEIARIAPINNPVNTITASTYGNSMYMTYVALNTINRQQQEKEYLATMHLVDQSAIAFPDDQPIVYPPADVWRDLTKARDQYRTVDMKQPGTAEAKIIKVLDEPIDMEYPDTPLKDIVDTLSSRLGITIVLDTKALADASVTPDTTFNKTLRGITLRQALHLLLADHDLNYYVDHEVLLITTNDIAKAHTVTKVYPVADLVLPINSGSSINPFGSGGGMGSGMSGMGGGMGGGGMGGMGGGGMGGMGGGGFGGGMGGGFGGMFDIPDNGQPVPSAPAANAAQATAAQVAPAATPTQVTPAAQAAAAQAAPAAGAEVAAIKLAGKDKDAEAAWNSYFAHLQAPDFDSKDPVAKQKADAELRTQGAAVRETARQLMNQQKFGEVASLIRGALRNGWGQAWMYEVLGLAMQADNQPRSEIERALMSAVTMARSNDDILYIATYLSRLGFDARALKLYRQVATMDPTRFEPYMHGLDVAVRLGDADGIQWACVGVLGQAWPNDKADIVDTARRTAIVTLKTLRDQKKTAEASRFAAALNEALVRDCLVRVSWNGDAEVDLTVEEPSGTVCSLRNPRTTSGGVLLTSSPKRDSLSDEGTSAQYVVTQGFAGKYRMLLRRVWGRPTAGKVIVEIYTHFGSKKSTLLRRQIPLGESDAVVEFALKDGRRHEALADAQVANAIQAMAGVNQAILAQLAAPAVSTTANPQLTAAIDNSNITQQLSAINDPTAQQSFSASRSSNPLNNNPGGVTPGGFFPFAMQGAVGYQPVITILPSGTNLVATAVISADRRYVRVTATPLFSSIGPVSTFNYETGASTLESSSPTGGGQIGNP